MSLESKDNRGVKSSIPYARQSIDEADIQSVVEALKSDFVTQGPRAGYFEDALCDYFGVGHAVVVSSGSAALHLACASIGLGPDGYGLVPAITFAATANCLRHCGAEVGFVDVDGESGLAGPAQFAEALGRYEGKGTPSAFLPVSFTGSVPDLGGIAGLARSVGSMVIEDAAHSLGARYERLDGSVAKSGSCSDSDAAIVSFHPVKHICAGEGGAVLTNDAVLAGRIRKLRSHGIEKLGDDWGYDQSELGFNYRMTEIQAALGLSQLGRIDAFLQRRAELAHRYKIAFSEKPFDARLQLATEGERSSWHLFVVRFASSQEREAAYRFLLEDGIRTQVHYMPVYRHSYYSLREQIDLPGAESFSSVCLSLPLYPELKDSEQDRVVERLSAFFSR